MKVWQPGGHLSEERGGEVRDWSWRRTRRRVGLLVRLALPYRGRTALALATLLALHARRAGAALPREARDRPGDPPSSTSSRLTWIIALFLAAAVVALLLSAANTYLTGWVGERVLADLRNKLFAAPGAALARLLRAQPRRRDHQPDHERRRGARPARHRRGHEPVQNTLLLARHRGHPLLPRLAARARDAAGADPDGAR